jgi:hypothetical protein
MKQNVIMTRKMGKFNVLQRTKDGMFNATDLAKQWSLDNNKKDVSDFLQLKGTKEFINALELELSVDTIKVVSVTKGGKHNAQGTWMTPLLYIDFAMWLNPSFKIKVLKFVYDELIKQRNDAGDGYVKLSASGVRLKGYDFIEVAKAIQWIVYGTTGKDLRQIATEEQLTEINDIQTKLSFAIDMGYIKSYEQLISELRKLYRMKHSKSPF